MAEPTNSTPDADAEVVAPEKKKRGGLLLLLPFLLLPAAGGAWLAFTQYARLDQVAEAAGLNAEPAEEEGEEESAIEYGQFTEIQNLIINPAGSDGRRYLMVNVGLETGEPKVLTELGEKDVVVRDAIIKLLGSRRVEELADIDLRGELKEELCDTVNAMLREGSVSRMYFTQYVLQ